MYILWEEKGTETTLHHCDTQNAETLPNSANMAYPLKSCSPYNSASKRCNLCLKEKFDTHPHSDFLLQVEKPSFCFTVVQKSRAFLPLCFGAWLFF